MSVQHSVGEPIPEFDQRPEEGTKVPPSSRRQDTGDIFPDDPAGLEFVSQPKKGESEVSPWVGESFAESGDGEGLAGCASDQKVDCSMLEGPRLIFGEGSIVRGVGVSGGKYSTGEGFDFRKAYWLKSEGMPSDGRGFHARADG